MSGLGAFYALKEEYEYGLQQVIQKLLTGGLSENDRLSLEGQRLTYRKCIDQLNWTIKRTENRVDFS